MVQLVPDVLNVIGTVEIDPKKVTLVCCPYCHAVVVDAEMHLTDHYEWHRLIEGRIDAKVDSK